MELSTRYEGITTSVRPDHPTLTPEEAVGRALGNVKYITRSGATRPGNVLHYSEGNLSPWTPTARSCFQDALRKRAQAGGKKGIRLAEKMMCSLPNSFEGEAAQEVVRLIMTRLACGSPEVRIIAAIHTDKPGNLHVHFLAIDGLETREAALARAKKGAKRVRQQSVIRLGERGRPRELRAMFAECINEVAGAHNLTKVEHLSFRDRGLSSPPSKHEGPCKRARKKREWFYSEWSDPIADVFKSAGPEPVDQSDDFSIESMERLIRASIVSTVKKNHRGRAR